MEDPIPPLDPTLAAPIVGASPLLLSTAAAVAEPAPVSTKRKASVLRSVLFLVFSQFVTAPLSMLVNAVLARQLGPDDFGTIYLATTMAGLGFLFVEWGQTATIATVVARDHDTAAEVLGSGLLLKLGGTVGVSLLLFVAARVLGYPSAVSIALGLVILQSLFTSLATGYQAVMRGYGRFDWVSGTTITANILVAIFVIPAAMNGGHLTGTLAAQAGAALLSLGVNAWLAHRSLVPFPRWSRKTAKMLLHTGTGFLLLQIVLAVQPNIDAFVLAKMSSSEVVGWFAAARRLVGVLIFPATTITFVLYPILVRLWQDDRAAFHRLTSSALRITIIIGVCVSAGTFLFADLAIRVVYGQKEFGPAVAVLQGLAAYIFLMFFSLILGNAVLASGRAVTWAGAQALCIVVSAVADPLLVPFFQSRWGNGGLGVCASLVISEALMLAAALFFFRGAGLSRSLVSAVLPALGGGAGMAAAVLLLPGKPVWLTMPLSVIVYFALVLALGGMDKAQLQLLKDIARWKTGGRGGQREAA